MRVIVRLLGDRQSKFIIPVGFQGNSTSDGKFGEFLASLCSEIVWLRARKKESRVFTPLPVNYGPALNSAMQSQQSERVEATLWPVINVLRGRVSSATICAISSVGTS